MPAFTDSWQVSTSRRRSSLTSPMQNMREESEK
jgi:hypothetical protein